ncbi:MAG: LysR family transcriptional regulator [Gammaproteobacteria bacterium]|nr:LysR family transcriptional regulator [Gammaproteobacteria bacterium]
MDFRTLRYFVTIVEQGSMKRAADALYVAQPALSQQVKKLEDELGVKLLSRSVRGVVPTEAGRELLARARLILDQVADARQAIQAGSRDPRGSVVLGLPASISAVLSVPLVVRMQEALPKVALRVVEGTSGYVLDWLRSGQLDLGILHGVQRDAGIATTPLFSEELFLVESASRRRRRRAVRFAELADMDLILPGRHHGLRAMLDRVALEHGVALAPKVEIDAFVQMKTLARLGIGNTVLSRAAVADEVARGELHAVPITQPRLERRMVLARAGSRPVSNAVRATAELLLACVSGFDGQYWSMAAEAAQVADL